MRSRVLGTWAVVFACVLLATAASANAANITSLIDFDPTGFTVNQISDDSVENILNFSGTLQVGDIIEGVLNITAVGDVSNTLKTVGEGTANNELTGIFRTVVKRITFAGNGPDGTFGTPDDLYYVAFGPDDTWSAAAALGVAGGAGTGTGAMVIFFEDSSQNFTKSGPPATDVANASDGKFFWALGFNTALPTDVAGDVTANSNSASEGWLATTRLTLPANNNQIGTAVYSLNRVFSTNAPNGATPIPGIGENYILGLQEGWASPSGVADVEVIGTTSFNSQISQIDPNNPNGSGWAVNDQSEFFILPLSVIPLPAAAWMGMALLGVLGIGRKLRRRT